jgi:hypothetical protein
MAWISLAKQKLAKENKKEKPAKKDKCPECGHEKFGLSSKNGEIFATCLNKDCGKVMCVHTKHRQDKERWVVNYAGTEHYYDRRRGWYTLPYATVFNERQKKVFSLPSNGKWVPLPDFE